MCNTNSFLLIPSFIVLYIGRVQLDFYIKQILSLKTYLAFKFRFEKNIERMKLNVSFG